MLLTIATCRAVTPHVQVQFAVAAPGRLQDELETIGVEVELLGDVRLSRPASVLQARTRLARVIEAQRGAPLIVICHAPWAYTIFAPVPRRRGVPVVLWQHTHASGQSLIERVGKQTAADLVICNSTWTTTSTAALQPALSGVAGPALSEVAGPALSEVEGPFDAVQRKVDVPVAVVHPPVVLPPIPNGTRLRIRTSLDAKDDVVILAASRVEPGKGLLNLVRAAGRLVDIPGWALWIAGAAQRPDEQTYLTEIQQEVTRLGLASRVRFLGERRDVPLLMSAADIFCQANELPDAFGIVFAEALLSGLPVITPRMGGAPEIVGETCGRLVPPGDLVALADAMRELIRQPALRRQLGTIGPAHAAARVAPDVVLPQLARTLESLVTSPVIH